MKRDPNLCPTCDRVRDHDPGDYYHEKGCEARVLRTAIEAVSALPSDSQVDACVKWLKARLEMAEYVGD